jgi:predicted outer membrane protein
MRPSFVRPLRSGLAVATASLVLTACGARQWFAEAPKGPTDANIGAILLAANNTDISYAQLAPTRAQRADVEQFASRMLADHTGVNGLANTLFAKIGLVPVENVTSLDFRDESAAKRDTLRELSGRSFDSAYAVNEVKYHTGLLAALDSVLIPGATAHDHPPRRGCAPRPRDAPPYRHTRAVIVR